MEDNITAISAVILKGKSDGISTFVLIDFGAALSIIDLTILAYFQIPVQVGASNQIFKDAFNNSMHIEAMWV